MHSRGRIVGTVAIIYAFNTSLIGRTRPLRDLLTYILLGLAALNRCLLHVAHYSAANLVCQVLFLDYT